jgi:hypothetical protein
MKGAQLPLPIIFTAGFLKKLRQVSKRYQPKPVDGPNQAPSSQGDYSEPATSSPVPPVNLSKYMRKTQQHGPPSQLFGALGSTLPSTSRSLRKATGNETFSPALYDTIEELEEDDGVKWENLLDSPSTKPKDPG